MELWNWLIRFAPSLPSLPTFLVTVIMACGIAGNEQWKPCSRNGKENWGHKVKPVKLSMLFFKFKWEVNVISFCLIWDILNFYHRMVFLRYTKTYQHARNTSVDTSSVSIQPINLSIYLKRMCYREKLLIGYRNLH